MVVRFINCFQVAVGQDERFLALWRRVNGYAQTKPGYLGHELHRAISSATRYRYINVASWASAEDFAAANDDAFRGLIADPEWSRFSFTPGLYEVIERNINTPDQPTATASAVQPMDI